MHVCRCKKRGLRRETFFIRRRVAVTLMRWRYRGGYVRGYSLRALLRLLHLTSRVGEDFLFLAVCNNERRGGGGVNILGDK